MSDPFFKMSTIDRMVEAVERVRRRVRRAAAALDGAGIPYAVAGDNAVEAWVASVEPAAVRTSKDVHLVLRRSDIATASVALALANFVPAQDKESDIFLDGTDGRVVDAVRIVFANEKIRSYDLITAPNVTDFEALSGMRVLSLSALVWMKLVSNRTVDKVHVRDMLDVNLLDASWLDRFPPELAERLQHLLDTPDG